VVRRALFVALLVAAQCGAALAEEAFKPFEFSFPVYMERAALPKPGPRLQVMFPSDFEVVDYRTGNGGPFFGRREEIEALRRQVGEPKLAKGVFQIMDVVRARPGEMRVFDRAANRFAVETQPLDEVNSLFKIQEMRRADTRSVPVLLVKAMLGTASVYSASLVLPDDAYVAITYWMPRPPTKLNEEIWERFAASIRER